MRIAKDGNAITSVDDWLKFAPPKSRDQWVKGRSAYELARAWCGSGTVAMPPELRALLESRQETRRLSVYSVTPEERIRFDQHGGEPRNADLALIGQTPAARVAITIEAKADEPFGGTVAETLSAALERLLKNPKSKGIARVADLSRALFLPQAKGQPKLAALRYQLMTATAGTLAYASKHDASLAVLVVHEFVTPKTRDARHVDNAADYCAFLRRLSGRPGSEFEKGGLVGPFILPGAPLFENVPPLLIGKVVTSRRPAGA